MCCSWRYIIEREADAVLRFGDRCQAVSVAPQGHAPFFRDQIQALEHSVFGNNNIIAAALGHLAAITVEAKDRIDGHIGAKNLDGPEQTEVSFSRHSAPAVKQWASVKTERTIVAFHRLIRPGYRPNIRRIGADLARVDGVYIRKLGCIAEPLLHLRCGRIVAHPIIHSRSGQRCRVLELPPGFPVDGYRIGIVIPDRHFAADSPGFGIDLGFD
ncbi:hypothetical protein D3C75_775170 [compost metagenome]